MIRKNAFFGDECKRQNNIIMHWIEFTRVNLIGLQELRRPTSVAQRTALHAVDFLSLATVDCSCSGCEYRTHCTYPLRLLTMRYPGCGRFSQLRSLNLVRRIPCMRHVGGLPEFVGLTKMKLDLISRT